MLGKFLFIISKITAKSSKNLNIVRKQELLVLNFFFSQFEHNISSLINLRICETHV